MAKPLSRVPARVIAPASFEQAVAAEVERLKIRHEAAKRFRAWRAEQANPTPRPDPRIVTDVGGHDRAALFANGKVSQPMLPPHEFDAWQSAIKKRADMRAGLDNSPCGIHAWEGAFLDEELQRHVFAKQSLLRGVDVADVAVKCDMSIEEVLSIRDALEGKNANPN